MPLTKSTCDRAPFYESILRFVERGQAPFYSPGHKGGRTLPREFKERVCELDLNNLPDTDTLHCPSGAILEAQELLAEAYGVAHSYMLVGGSTAGNVAALLATLRPGERVLVQRNAHKSVIAGIIQVGAVPVWLRPAVEETFEIALGPSARDVEAAFDRHPDARTLLVLNPTYFGTTPDIRALSAVCRARGKLLIVDEAHGPHFHFHDELPTAAEDVGADAIVQSTHKILSGLSQAAVLHTSTALDAGRVRECLQLIQTTSPNFAILASIDLSRQQMVTRGHEWLDRTLALARRARAGLSTIPGVEVLDERHHLGAGSGFHQHDETKIVVGTRGLGLSGREVQSILNRDFGVQPEIGGSAHVLFILTIGNVEQDVERLVSAMRAIAKDHRNTRKSQGMSNSARALLSIDPRVELTPREAFFARAAVVDLAASVGRVCAEVVTPYPPGIPALMPGELVTRELRDALSAVQRAGNPVSASDPSLATLRVVA
jgi:arginine/lysine/ornithine decarboxylase